MVAAQKTSSISDRPGGNPSRMVGAATWSFSTTGDLPARLRLDASEKAPRNKQGTTATLQVQTRFRVPQHDNLLRKLRNHFALRPLLLDDKGRDVTLADLSQERSDKVRFVPPRANLLEKSQFPIPGYQGQHLELQLYQASEPLTEEGEEREYWRHSILVESGRAAYEVFDGGKFSREPYASHLRRIYGYASVPGINELIREFDDAEGEGTAPGKQNPVRLVRRDRHGLAARRHHPFVDAVYTVLEGALEPHLERLRKAAEEAGGQVSDEARRRWERAGRELARLMDEAGAGSGLEGHLPPLGLSLIPAVRHVEPGETARLLVRYRPREDDPLDVPSWGVEVTESDEEGPHEPVSLNLQSRNGYFSRTYTITGREEGAISEVMVRTRTDEKKALVEWFHRSTPPVENLEFEHARFSIKDGQERWIALFAPWDMVTDVGEQVRFQIEGDSNITLRSGLTGVFTHDEDRDAGVCRIRARGHGIGSRARLTATLGDDVAETELIVASVGVAGIRIDIREEKIEQRAWMEAGRVCVNAKDPTVGRYLGPKNENWPGQNSVPFNVMLAEVIVEAAARGQLLQKETGIRDVSTLFGKKLELMRKWLPRIHRVLVPDPELKGARSS